MNVRIIWQFGGVTTVLEDFGDVSVLDYTISNMCHWLSRHEYWSAKKCCEGSIMLIIGTYYDGSKDILKLYKSYAEKMKDSKKDKKMSKVFDKQLKELQESGPKFASDESDDEKELREFTDQAAVELHKRMLKEEEEEEEQWHPIIKEYLETIYWKHKSLHKMDKRLYALDELIGEERMEDFLEYPENYIVYNIYSDDDE